MSLKRAFTLIELLTVMAVSAILLTVIAIPLVQSFNLTRAGQSLAAAQAQAREMSERISADIAAAAAVRDNTGDKGSMLVVLPGRDGALEEVVAPHAKLDLFMPSRKPVQGAKVDPTLAGPNGDLNLPASPGTVMVRWFLGRRDPFLDYGIPHIDLRTDAANRWRGTTNGQDNPYVLYRAEVPAYIDVDPDPDVARYESNWNLFERGADGQPVVDDPAFFTITAADRAAGAAQVEAKSARIRAWLRYAKNMSLNGRVDSLVFDYHLQTRVLSFAGNRPVFSPAVRMQPTRVASEAARPVNPMASGNEAPNPVRIGPAAYRIAAGSWSDFALTINPALHPAAYDAVNQAASPTLAWTADPAQNIKVGIARSGGQSFLTQEPMGPTFRLDDYWRMKSLQAAPNPPYPFSEAHIVYGAIGEREQYIVAPNPQTGDISASFGISEVGSDRSWPLSARLPSSIPGTPAAPTPGAVVGPDDPFAASFVTGGSLADWQTGAMGVNGRFNMLWNQWDDLLSNAGLPAGSVTREQFARRFIDLRYMAQPDGVVGPLHPSRGWKRAFIVPGSESVIAPDQRPGPNFGRYVRYRRSATRPVGPNEYYINYTHQPEPDWAQLGITASYSPLVSAPTDFVASILQAPYRAGYIELNSAPGEPLPNILSNGAPGNGDRRIVVNYAFAFTDPRDAVLADYSTNDVVDVSVTVLNYAPTGGPNPQKITLQATAEARNVVR
jgi:prepilin-type N-terminal cleavage/methylation domain-containing protein